MRPKVLRHRIKQLDANTPRYRALEIALGEGVGFGTAWYGSQKEHWLGWLAEYSGAGAYGRKLDPARDARFVYNHIQCAPMLFWLIEALGVFEDRLGGISSAIIEAPDANASQCAALRKLVPWSDVEAALLARTVDRRWFRWVGGF
jgi:hypothetical protein